MKAVFSSQLSYKEYRDKLHSISPPCVPYLGIYLTDMTFIEDGNLDSYPNGCINFTKRVRFAKVLQEIQMYQQTAYRLMPVQEIQEYLAAMSVLDEDEAFELSLKCEPRAED